MAARSTPGVAANPGKTGIHALPQPHDAFAARVLLAAAAEKSLDVQYYIWHRDQVGYLLFEALWQAAERGVRVRLLLDDLNTGGLDPTIAALDAHPNIEVRLYNPLVQRDARALNFLTDFARVNRRMHNKSFTADNQVSIVGGRNIGNEYFGAGSGVGFIDLDVIAVGAAVRDVSREFDLYWNSPSAYPAASFAGTAGPDAAANLEATFRRRAPTRNPSPISTPCARHRSCAICSTDNSCSNGRRRSSCTTTRPRPSTPPAGPTCCFSRTSCGRSADRNRRSTSSRHTSCRAPEGTAALAALAKSGVKVRILTNSLAASDEKSVHAGYAKRRQDLLRAGVQLYELKPTAAKESREDKGGIGTSSSSALARENFRRGPQPHLRRLIQLRPALGAA